jgi:hypothetical protein
MTDNPTLGHIWDSGGRIAMRCKRGRVVDGQLLPACDTYMELIVPTLVATHGRKHPLSALTIICPGCGSTKVEMIYRPGN